MYNKVRAIVAFGDKAYTVVVIFLSIIYGFSPFRFISPRKRGDFLLVDRVNKLKELRAPQDYHSHSLQKKSGANLRTIKALEQGSRDINKLNLRTAYNLAKALGCSMEELL